MQLSPSKPLLLTCNSCGKQAETWNGSNPDAELVCDCCPVDHDHAGLGCRTITISAFVG